MGVIEKIVAMVASEVGLSEPVAEYRFHPTRRWRADFAFLRERILLEIEGGAWTYGRHTRPRGFLNDMEKYNEAVLNGWLLLRVTPQQVKALDPLRDLLTRALSMRAPVVAPKQRARHRTR